MFRRNRIIFFPTGLHLRYLRSVRHAIKFGVKSNLHYTRDITPKRVTSVGARLLGLAPGLHSSEGTLQRWRAVGDTADLTDPEFEPQTSRTDSVCAK